MGAVWTPGKKTLYTQPQGRVEIAPEFKDSVLSAAIGGSFYNVATRSFETTATDGVNSGVNQGGSCDVPSGGSQAVVENATPGDSFLILCQLSPRGLSGSKQILAYDSSGSPVDRNFQFRTADTDLSFIRFNAGGQNFSVTVALGIVEGGYGTVLAWSNGLNYGLICPGGEVSGTMTGTAKPWGSSAALARWYQRRSNAIPNEPSEHRAALRAVLVDPGSQEARRELYRNPWQIFKPKSSRFISLPPAHNVVWTPSKTRIRQPQGRVEIDRSHPLAVGLIRCLVPGVSRFDLVTGDEWLSAGTGNTAPYPDYAGLSFEGDASGVYAYYTNLTGSGVKLNNFSMLHHGRWRVSADIDNFRHPPGLRGSGSDRWLVLGIRSFNGDGPWTLLDRDFTSNFTVAEPTGQINNSLKSAVGVVDLDRNLVSCSVNGIISEITPAALSTETAGLFSTTGSGSVTGMSSGRYVGCPVYILALWDRPLSAEESVSLSANPWQIFKPAKSLIFLPRTVPLLADPFSTAITDTSATPNVGVEF